MGPYCKFCGFRCFVLVPRDAPQDVRSAYAGRADIMATCPRGMEFERQKLGKCYADCRPPLEVAR